MSQVKTITKLSEIKTLTSRLNEEKVKKNIKSIRTINELINRFEEIINKIEKEEKIIKKKQQLKQLKIISDLLIDSLKRISKRINEEEKEIISFNELKKEITKKINEEEKEIRKEEINYLKEETKKERERIEEILNKKRTKKPLYELLNKIRGTENNFFKTISEKNKERAWNKKEALYNKLTKKLRINEIISSLNRLVIMEELIIKEALKEEALSNKQKQRIIQLIKTLNENKRIINQALKQKIITNELINQISANDNKIIKAINEELIKPDKIIEFIKNISSNYVPTIIKARNRDYYAMLSISTNTYRLDSDRVMDKNEIIDINAMYIPLAYHYGLIKPREKNLNINLKIKKKYLYENDYSYTRIVNYGEHKIGIILLKKETYKLLKERMTRITTHLDKRYNSCLFVYKVNDNDKFTKRSHLIFTTDSVNEIINGLKDIIKE